MNRNKVNTLFFYLLISAAFLFVQCQQAQTIEKKTVAPKAVTKTQEQQQKDNSVLKYRIRPSNDASQATPALILLHGYRSNDKDMFGWAGFLPKQYTVISAQAPIEMGTNAYAWYKLDFSNGKSYSQEEAEKARLLVIEFIQQMIETHNLDKDNIYVGGFSQGGMMSYAVGMTSPDLIKGIAPLSGQLLKETEQYIKENKAKLDYKALKAFISHGTADKVLSVSKTREAVKILESNGVETIYVEEKGLGHSTNKNIIEQLIKWLNE